MVDLALGPAPLVSAGSRLWHAPAVVTAAFAVFAVWYFWSWHLSAGEAAWISALFVVPPLLVSGFLAALIRLAVTGLDHYALQDLRAVLYGPRRARWPAFVRLFEALLMALFGRRLISVRAVAVSLAIAASAFLVGVAIWALVEPGVFLTIFVDTTDRYHLGNPPHLVRIGWMAFLFATTAPATFIALFGARLASRTSRHPAGLVLMLVFGAVVSVAVLALGYGLFETSFGLSLEYLVRFGFSTITHPDTWTFRALQAAALYPVFLPLGLFLALAFGLGTVRLLTHSARPLGVIARRSPVRATVLLLIGFGFIANAGIVMWRAENTPRFHDMEHSTTTTMAPLDALNAQAEVLISPGGDQYGLWRLPYGDYRVEISGDRSVFDQHRKTFEDNFAIFSDLTRRKISTDVGAKAPNTLRIVLTPVARLNTWAWREGAGLNAGLANGEMLCLTLPRYSLIYIGNDLPAKKLRECVAHELAHFVGLLGHACFARPSVLCRHDSVTHPTESDQRIIRALYSPPLYNGMPRGRAMQLLRNMPHMTRSLADRTPGY